MGREPKDNRPGGLTEGALLTIMGVAVLIASFLVGAGLARLIG